MKVIAEQEIRLDLAQRREVKFSLPGADVGKLRCLLKGACRSVKYNKSISVVRSIYFDDWNLRTYRANISGLCRRKKFRLRWYDQKLPGVLSFFEVKWRDNLLTGKYRFKLQTSLPISSLSYRKMVESIADALPPLHREMLSFHSEPIVIVQYKREHFESYDGTFRLTLDYDLGFHDQRATSFPKVSSFIVTVPGYVVIEGKGPLGKEKKLREILAPFQPRATRSSKYVIGCKSIGVLGNRTNQAE